MSRDGVAYVVGLTYFVGFFHGWMGVPDWFAALFMLTVVVVVWWKFSGRGDDD